MKVSVPVITYNHEPYIAKALDSILMQKTSFEFEAIIGEDCSTDNTRNILISYQKQYPNIIKLLLNDKNMGAQYNARQTYGACTGEYIASLDGDDYWTSPDKLQKQVDFLDSHPECSVCFHDALIVYEDGSNEPSHYRPSQKEFSTVEDLLLDNYIPTCAVMYRRGLIQKTPDWFDNLKMGDWPTHILNAHYGKVGFIDETLAVYVVHPGGIWSTKNWQFREFAIIELYETLKKHLDPKYDRIIDRFLRWKYLWVSQEFEKTNNIAEARVYLVKSIMKHLAVISRPFHHKLDPGLANDMPDYIRMERTKKLFKRYLRLFLVPFLSKYGPTVLKPRAPRLYHFLRARVSDIFKI